MSDTRYHYILLAIVSGFFIWSAINPHDYLTWCLEVAPAVIGFIILASTYHRFRFTNPVYTLIAFHATILIIGGHYTYAEVPLFNWLRDIGIFERNNFDKIGHFTQGFVPAMIARELLLRTSPLKPGKWLTTLIIGFCGAVAAFYEIIEWWTAVLVGEASDSFLGTQGYVWDTQSDMALCFLGASIALLVLSRWHQKQLKTLLGNA